MATSDITKQSIVSNTKKLVSEKGFEKLSVIEITKACGINRNTFYYHFKDKYEVIEYIFNEELKPELDKYTTGRRLPESVTALCNIMKKEKAFYTNALNYSSQNSLQQLLINYYVDYLLKVGKERYARIGIEGDDQTIIARFYSHGIVGLICDWSRNNMKKDADTVTRMVMLSVKEQVYT